MPHSESIKEKPNTFEQDKEGEQADEEEDEGDNEHREYP